jgi:hypothetical protein
MRENQSEDQIFLGKFTDRGRGQRLVLSASTSVQIPEQVKANGIYHRSHRGMEKELLCM